MAEGDLLWQPPITRQQQATITRYVEWLRHEKGLNFATYDELWSWSVTDVPAFWESIWQFFDVRAHADHSAVLAKRSMPGAQWFPGAKLNYAEHALRAGEDDSPAVIAYSEVRDREVVTWGELRRQVAAAAAGFRKLGVRRGDRIAAYVPNIVEAAVAALAAASIGAVWSSCSPDFGIGSVVDRFRQIEPRLLLAVDGYKYGGKDFDRLAAVARLRSELSTVETTVIIPYRDRQAHIDGDNNITWQELTAPTPDARLEFEPVPFDHPLWILYSSGTTGLPKPIVHCHGGILLEHLKVIALHHDLKLGDRFLWFTTTGWMMWNYLLSGLLVGTTIVLFDGNPGYPDLKRLWRLVAHERIAVFGTSAPFIHACMRAALQPGRELDLSPLRSVGSTGAPLSPEGFAWLHDAVKSDLWVASVSGGTDLCTAFVLGCPLLPVHAGELQCRGLGAKVEAYDHAGQPVLDHVGELVITEPMPSMPVGFWNDPGNNRYRESYFDVYPGVWRHGDWIRITPRGSAVIYGRSDATINRRGIRIGTAEIYRALETVPGIADSLVVSLDQPDGESEMWLFVVPSPGTTVDEQLQTRIRTSIRQTLSPRHLPDQILSAPAIPVTLNGKKMEVPVRRILMGTPPEQAVHRDSMANPEAIDFFVDLAREVPPSASANTAS